MFHVEQPSTGPEPLSCVSVPGEVVYRRTCLPIADDPFGLPAGSTLLRGHSGASPQLVGGERHECLDSRTGSATEAKSQLPLSRRPILQVAERRINQWSRLDYTGHSPHRPARRTACAPACPRSGAELIVAEAAARTGLGKHRRRGSREPQRGGTGAVASATLRVAAPVGPHPRPAWQGRRPVDIEKWPPAGAVLTTSCETAVVPVPLCSREGVRLRKGEAEVGLEIVGASTSTLMGCVRLEEGHGA